jgi:hypothetical protein
MGVPENIWPVTVKKTHHKERYSALAGVALFINRLSMARASKLVDKNIGDEALPWAEVPIAALAVHAS